MLASLFRSYSLTDMKLQEKNLRDGKWMAMRLRLFNISPRSHKKDIKFGLGHMNQLFFSHPHNRMSKMFSYLSIWIDSKSIV